MGTTPPPAASAGDPFFYPSADPESARLDEGLEELNAARAAALVLRLDGLAKPDDEVLDDLAEIGFPESRSPRFAGRPDPIESFEFLPQQHFEAEGALRVDTWREFSEYGEAQAALGFLVEVLASPLELESTAAAAVLRRYLEPLLAAAPPEPLPFLRAFARYPEFLRDPSLLESPEPFEDEGELAADRYSRLWPQIYGEALAAYGAPIPAPVMLSLAEARLSIALRSQDSIARSFAIAALAPFPALVDDRGEAPEEGTEEASVIELLSTMIHGTAAWKGMWWRPQGDFHRYVKGGLRPNLFSGGARFGWSGAYSTGQRARAATDFFEWASEQASGGLQTVFAHSFGGEIGARAVELGTSIDELVLLSAPVTRALEEGLPDVHGRVVDIRLRFDPVLALARTRQRIRLPNVTTVLLRRWTMRHGATHDPAVWEREDLAGRAGL